MDLFASFRLILDTERESVHRFLTFLQQNQGKPENRPLKIQLKFALSWCMLARFLYENRHKQLVAPKANPLKFLVCFDQPCYTPCYWYEAFYEVWLLSTALCSETMYKLDLKKQANEEANRACFINDVEDYVLYMIQAMALLRFCLENLSHCRSFCKLYPEFGELLRLRLHWFSIVSLWVQGHQQYADSCQMFQACVMAVQNSPEFSDDPLIQAIARNSRIQAFLGAAEIYDKQGDRTAKSWCYLQASKEGWRQTKRHIERTGVDVEKLASEFNNEQKQPKLIMMDGPDKHEIKDLGVKQPYVTGWIEELDAPLRQPLALRPCMRDRPIKFKPTPPPVEPQMLILNSQEAAVVSASIQTLEEPQALLQEQAETPVVVQPLVIETVPSADLAIHP